ncbi:MAG: hypothetical protein LCH63_19250 [Candidatus Melainabacteria bacterium]|nr:hypothetical protein [Candidatus Melainabacteria bacterium]
MLFSSVAYLLFFPVVLALFWLLPHRFRSLLLFIASYYFYMSWIPAYGLLLFALTVGNYLFGLAIGAFREKPFGKGLLALAVLLNLSTLCYFKYTDFFLASINKALAQPWLSLNVSAFPLQHVLLPLGISFFVFEFIHYVVDVHRGSSPVKNFINFSLFAAFFPSQIAGPIKRYQQFVKQLEERRVFSAALFEKGLALLLQGLFKKIAVADNLSNLVAHGFSMHTLGCADAWVSALAFAIQIYCDFSGYTDMGRGSALMMGFDLPDNFNYPYLAKNLSDFWKRWHISLSTWLRDYLYIALGGNRVGVYRRYFNLFMTMLLGGLWHGASWHFVVWGAFHGLGLIFSHTYDHYLKEQSSLAESLRQFHSGKLGTVISIVSTFLFVLVGWVFFRAESMSEALRVLQAMLPTGHSLSLPFTLYGEIQHSSVISVLLSYSIYRLIVDNCSRLAPLLPATFKNLAAPRIPARALLYLAVFFLAVSFAPNAASPFIYFAF